jgi:predicted nucleic acid-binding protein
MGALASALASIRGQRVYFDANFFIYFLARSGKYFDAVEPMMRACDQGEFQGVTGHATMSEVLVLPYRQQSPEEIARVKSLFSRQDLLEILRHDEKSFDLAAQIRARHGLKLIDALHYATALNAGCRYFVSNDIAFRRGGTLEIISIADLVGK